MVPGQRVFYTQSFAVIIFIVFSGYLIPSAVLKKRTRPDFTFGSYIIDRVARAVCSPRAWESAGSDSGPLGLERRYGQLSRNGGSMWRLG
jgi:hypothetical protein